MTRNIAMLPPFASKRAAEDIGTMQNRDDDQGESERERRLQRLITRLPDRMQRMVTWLRRPQARWVRIPVGLLLIVGGCLAILPIFGLWMLPLGVVLLAEDVPSLRRLTGRALEWIERRHPNWMAPAGPGS
jgi:hypothetical protein